MRSKAKSISLVTRGKRIKIQWLFSIVCADCLTPSQKFTRCLEPALIRPGSSILVDSYPIVNAMMGIEHANPDTLAGLFSAFDDANWTDKTKLDDERLKNLIEHMSALPVGNRNYSADVMGDAYEYLIKKFADMSKKNAGEFYTPRSVVKLMVRMLQPRSGESVYESKTRYLIQFNDFPLRGVGFGRGCRFSKTDFLCIMTGVEIGNCRCDEKAGKRPMASVIVLIFEKIAVALFLYKNLTERRCSL